MSKFAFFFLVIYLQSALASAKYLSCPSGWVTYRGSSSCYRFGTSPTTKWAEARKACLSMGGDLVKIRSAQENRYVAFLARIYSSNTSYMWIGLVRDHNDIFTWVDGSFMTGQYSNWKKGEPSGTQEKCGMMYLNRMEWNDTTCANTMFYLCEREKLAI